jgi:RNA polymerase sigma-70 factor (ECF subfamily)
MDGESLERLARKYQRSSIAEERQDCAGQIIIAIGRPIGALVQKYFYQPERAKDALQTVLMEICKSLDRFSETGRFVSWCFRIARNICINEIRSEKRDKMVFVEPDQLQECPAEEIEDYLKEKDFTKEKLDNLLEQLSERCRRLLGLRFFNELLFREIGLEMEMTESAVKMATERCRAEALELLQKARQSHA